MKKIIFILISISIISKSYSQTYNPAIAGVTLNTPVAPAQATPTDSRSMFFDPTFQKWRPYVSTTEVLTYLNLAKYRAGNFDIIVNTGGSLSAGVITGGVNNVYFFKNGTSNSDLVLKGNITSVNNQTGAVTVGNADSLKSLPIDTSANVDGYVVTFDKANRRFILTVKSAGTNYTQGPGINITGSVISALNTQALWNANQLRGRNISATAPNVGQIPKWDGLSYTPSDDLSGIDTAYYFSDTLYLVTSTKTIPVYLSLPTTSINIFNSDGALEGNRILSGANHSLQLGTPVSKLKSAYINGDSASMQGDSRLKLDGPLVLRSVLYDGSVDIVVSGGTLVTLANLSTASRNVYLTDALAKEEGRVIEIINKNTSGTYSWSFSSSVIDLAGNTVTVIPNASTIPMYYSNNQWYIKGVINATPGGGGSTYSFTSGLTEAAGTVTNDLITGKSGGQTILSGTGAGEDMTLEASSNSTKGLIKLLGGMQFSNSPNITNADFTANSGMNYLVLPTITANRTLTLPAIGKGGLMLITNMNNNGFNWNFAPSTVEDELGNDFPFMPNVKSAIFMHDGTTWRKLTLSDTTGIGDALVGTSLNLSGYTVNGIKNNLLDNSSIFLPTQAAVNAGIAAAIAGVPGGNVLTRWYNIVALGGVADGTSIGGTDNSTRAQKLIDSLPSNSWVYFPGNFRFAKPLVVPNGRLINLWFDGNTFSGDSTLLIIDQNNIKVVHRGEMAGRYQGSGSSWVGLTNAGIFLREAQYCFIETNIISGYRDAFRLGGYSSPIATGKGAQYNVITWARLFSNYRGMLMTVDGTTSNSIKGWCNSNLIFGGCINGFEGVRFQRGLDQTDPFNQNYFFNIGFENGGFFPAVMDTAITAEFATQNTFWGARFEGNTLKKKIKLRSNCTSNSFYGVTLFDWDLTDPGVSSYFNGRIFSKKDTRLIGTEAKGYPDISGSSENGKVKIYGLKRIGAMVDSLPPNVDLEFEKVAWANASFVSSSYTAPYAVKYVFCNATGTNNVLTSNLRLDDEITIVNLNTSGSVVSNGVTIGPATGTTYTSMKFYNQNGTTRLIGTGNVGGGSGSSQWTTDANGIYYNGKVAIGRTAATALAHIGYKNTPSTPNSGGLKVDGGTVLLNPENGMFENDLFDPFYTSQGTRKKILTTENVGTVTIVMGNMAEINDANYTVVDNINCVIYNSATGTKVLTIPNPVNYPNREISIKNEGASAISIPVGYYTTNSTLVTTLASGAGIRIKSNSTKWRTVP